MSHANAALTPRARLKLARLIVEDGWTVARAAERFQVSWPTAKRWADRYAEVGDAGMQDRSSRPHRQPTKTPQPLVRKIVHVRCKRRVGPVEIAGVVGAPASTVHAVLRRCRISRLSALDRASGQPVRRYEHARPGSLLHVDVKKLGNIPDGGGWRKVGRAQGQRNRTATPTTKRGKDGGKNYGHAYVHTVVDDHSRVAYAEIHDDEQAVTATGVLRRAVLWFAARGVAVERVLTDNGPATAAMPGASSATTSRSLTPAPGPTGRRRTAKSSASTAPSPQAGPSGGSTSASRPDDAPCRPGCTSTTTTATTARSARSRPSAG